MEKRWGFLGTGRITRRMTEAVRQANDASLSGIASREPTRAAAWASERNAETSSHEKSSEKVRAYQSYAALLDDPSIDWVYIALPPSLHYEWSLAALQAGKHVLCEKPLCLNAVQSVALASAAHSHQRQLFHATAFPYHPRSLAARQIIQSGELGDVRRIHVACSFSGILSREHDHRIESSLGGGCLLDLGWYCVFSTLWFTGLDCLRLQAVGTKLNGVWYQVQVLAELTNGAVAHWDCGFDAAPRRWMEIAGVNASWICDDFLRPLDLNKPRFWIHGLEGHSRTETIGHAVFQEALMIEACQHAADGVVPSASNDPPAQALASRQLKLAIRTQQLLDGIAQSLEKRGQVSFF